MKHRLKLDNVIGLEWSYEIAGAVGKGADKHLFIYGEAGFTQLPKYKVVDNGAVVYDGVSISAAVAKYNEI